MFIYLPLFLLVSCNAYSMDNSPRKEEQDWTSQKELTKTLGYWPTDALKKISSTSPDKIKNLKFPKGALLKATKATHKTGFDEIFNQEQWEMLHNEGILAIIDKYRPDSVSTWYLIDEKQEKTPQNTRRNKREYCYATPKNKRTIITLQHNKAGHVFITKPINLASEFLDGQIKVMPLQHIILSSENPFSIKDKGNAKQFTITWENSEKKAQSQTWRAKRAIKESRTFDEYLKNEFSEIIKCANCAKISENPGYDKNSTGVEGMEFGIFLFKTFMKYGVPEDELLKLNSKTCEGNSEAIMDELIQKYIAPTQIADMQTDLISFFEKNNIKSEDDLTKKNSSRGTKTFTILTDTLNVSHAEIVKKSQ